jgi:hypothetical protein
MTEKQAQFTVSNQSPFGEDKDKLVEMLNDKHTAVPVVSQAALDGSRS